MADLPADFWSGWIVVLTVCSMGGLTWFVVSLYFGQDATDHAESPVWDETLTEGEHPAPMWWFWMTLCAMIFSVIYLMLYPGLGSFAGLLEWSQGHDIERSQIRYDENFAARRAALLDVPLAELRADERAMASARRVFREHWAACHGRDGKGQASAFPNLADAVWQWGAEPAQIEQSIVAGRVAVMPGWDDVVGSSGVRHLAAYVAELAENGADSADAPAAQGAVLFGTYCSACHGASGTGNVLLGAPNLTDPVWLYGAGEAELQHSIGIGRQGEMPALGERLDAVQVRLLVALLTGGNP